MDKEIKRKLRRIWCKRLVIGLLCVSALGFSLIKFYTVFNLVQLIQTEKPQRDISWCSQRLNPKKEIHLTKEPELELELSSLLIILGISMLCFSVMSILSKFLSKQKNLISLTLTGQLICFFPEECIGELEALHQQLKSEHYSTSLIRIIMLQNFILLFFQFYVQINIENLCLPQQRGRKNIDE